MTCLCTATAEQYLGSFATVFLAWGGCVVRVSVFLLLSSSGVARQGACARRDETVSCRLR